MTRAKDFLNENKIHAERLNERDFEKSMRKSELFSKEREEDPKRFSRLIIGHKSNRMVLNECAARLGVSLRQTEDQLTRDMLASTASFINCTGGTNGKFVAVLKSLLIDLESEVAFS